jgi:catechol 2,3-dioxygenase-like lactoylglutathione lyase family enzyme
MNIRVLETALYVESIEKSQQFYQQLFGFELIFADDRLHALSIADQQVLLLFKKDSSSDGADAHDGHIPGHDGYGRLHLCFAIEKSDLEQWKRVLESNNIEIESELHPPTGSTCIYFRDPDNHLIELATPGLWKIY